MNYVGILYNYPLFANFGHIPHTVPTGHGYYSIYCMQWHTVDDVDEKLYYMKQEQVLTL